MNSTPSEDRKLDQPAEDALRLHPFYRGKVQMMPKCAVRDLSDFSIWYTPGVAAPCRAIADDPASAYEHTNKGNTIAIVSDGSRVLGLGPIGPLAAMPVMEGKALLFKYLGGVDAVPLCVDCRDGADIVRTVLAVQPSFGGINLEDISQPTCFDVLDELQRTADIPVWHDDQQGTATVVLAALLNALRIVGKDLARVRVAMVGMGAANVATYRLLRRAGLDPAGVVACDTNGTLHRGRHDVEAAQHRFRDKWRVCQETNADGVGGGIGDALRGADVCISFAAPGAIDPAGIRAMAGDAIVFACANPVPDIWPWDARDAGARIVATGRGDLPNQVNNALAFPGVFRGVLDVRATKITETMTIAAAQELASCTAESALRDDVLLPKLDDPDAAARVAAAVGWSAVEEGIAGRPADRATLLTDARRQISAARDATRVLMDAGLIPPPPDE